MKNQAIDTHIELIASSYRGLTKAIGSLAKHAKQFFPSFNVLTVVIIAFDKINQCKYLRMCKHSL